MKTTRDRIMDAAESAIRSGGFGAFSFRTVANELAIKSSSVHHHFPSKDLLGQEVVLRYRQRFIEDLGKPESKGGLERFAKAFQNALNQKNQICLCGVLTSESGDLSEGIRQELQQFCQDCRKWLALAAAERKHNNPKAFAMVFFAALEGGMAFAALNKNPSELTTIASYLLKSIDSIPQA